MPYSFKLLVHEVKLQIKDALIIEEPTLSISLANFPKMNIHGQTTISTGQSNKSFNHGKSAFLNMDQDRMEFILKDRPLEMLLLNKDRILATAKINLQGFIPDIEKELKFKRGNFHLLDHAGRPYAIADLSIAIHRVDEQPNEQKKQSEEPPPDDIVFNKKRTSGHEKAHPMIIKDKSISQIYNNIKPQKDYILNEEQFNEKKDLNKEKIITSIIPPTKKLPNSQPRIGKSKPLSKEKLKSTSKTKQQTKPKSTSKQIPKKQSPPKQRPKTATASSILKKYDPHLKIPPNKSVIIKEKYPLPDIPIDEWVNALHCPPPLILDKKIYVHETYNDKREITPVYIKPGKLMSKEIQTEPFQNDVVYPQYMERTKTVGTESNYYNDDFESVGQQSQVQIKTPRILQKSQTSPNNDIIKEQLDEDEIYQEDFDQFSQSQSFRQSRSKQEITESYIPDFDSVVSTSQHRKR